MPGQKTTTYTQLLAGTYALACFVPAPDGKTHAEHGMMKVFTVSGKSKLEPPTSGVGYVTWSLPAGSYAYVSTEGDAPNDDYSRGLYGTFTVS